MATIDAKLENYLGDGGGKLTWRQHLSNWKITMALDTAYNVGNKELGSDHQALFDLLRDCYLDFSTLNIRTYNLNRYDKEKQMALEAWERKINSIMTGNEGKVIPITAKQNAA